MALSHLIINKWTRLFRLKSHCDCDYYSLIYYKIVHISLKYNYSKTQYNFRQLLCTNDLNLESFVEGCT